MSTLKNSCSIYPKVKVTVKTATDKVTGEVKEVTSYFYKKMLGLHEFCPSFTRTKANDVYCLTKTKKFRELFDDNLPVDEYGEPTLVSLWEATGDSTPLGEVTHALMRDYLAKKFGEGHYSYEEALLKATEFNLATNPSYSLLGRIKYGLSKKTGSSLRELQTFIGIVTYDAEARSYKFSVAYNAVENQRLLLLTIAEHEMDLMIRQKLARKGVAVVQMDESDERNKNATGTYNTKDPEVVHLMTAEGTVEALLGVISLKDPNFDLSTLSDETGHFIIASLGYNHKLVTRLRRLIEGKNGLLIAKLLLGDNLLLGDEFETLKNEKANFVQEAIGHLVSKYIKERVAKEAKWRTYPTWRALLARTVDAGYNLISHVYNLTSFAGDWKIAKAIARKTAARTAKNMAELFLSGNFKGTLENALKQKLFLHSDDKFKSEVRRIILSLGTYINELEAMGLTNKDTDELKNALREYSKVYNSSRYDDLGAEDYVDLIITPLITVIKQLLSYIDDAASIIEEDTNLDGVTSIKQELWVKAAQCIRSLESIYTLIKQVKSRAIDSENSIRALDISAQNSIRNDIEDARRQADEMNANISRLRNKLVVSFLTEVNGCDAFYRPSYRSLSKKVGAEYVKLSEYLDKADIGMLFWPDRYLYAMSSHLWVVNQLIQKAVLDLKHKADVATEEFVERIRDLYGEYLKTLGYTKAKTGIFHDTNKFFERRPGNNFTKSGLTGNFVQELYWGKWQKDKSDYIKLVKEDFLQENVGIDKLFRDARQALNSEEWEERINEAMENWHTGEDIGIARSIKEVVIDGKKVLLTEEMQEKLDSEGVDYKFLEGRWVPNDEIYHNKLWDELTGEIVSWDENGEAVYDGEKGILQKLMSMKAELDEMLPPNIAPSYRMPQYTGDLIGSIANAYRGKNPLVGAVSGTLRASLNVLNRRVGLQRISQAAEAMFGNDDSDFRRSLNEEGELPKTLAEVREDEEGEIYNSEYLAAIGSIRSLPLYGINKLRNMDELSTDPFGLLIAHALTCYSYNAMLQVANLAEVTRSRVDEDSTIGATPVTRKNENSTKNKALSDLDAFMDLHVYKLKAYLAGDSWQSKKSKILLHAGAKLAKLWAGATSLFLLGGNTISALVNLHTAGWEIFKTAWRGEKYNLWDWAHAHFTLAYHLITSLAHFHSGIDSGEMYNSDKFFMLAKRLNFAHGNNYRNFNFHRRAHYAISLLSLLEFVMAPYSVTDFLIQSLGYIAAMHHTKVVMRSSNGKIVKTSSLWNAYQVRKRVTIDKVHKDFLSWYKNDLLTKSGYRLDIPNQANERYDIMEDDQGVYINGEYAPLRDDNNNFVYNELGEQLYERDLDHYTGYEHPIYLPDSYTETTRDAHEVYIDPRWEIYDKNAAEVAKRKNKIIISKLKNSYVDNGDTIDILYGKNAYTGELISLSEPLTLYVTRDDEGKITKFRRTKLEEKKDGDDGFGINISYKNIPEVFYSLDEITDTEIGHLNEEAVNYHNEDGYVKYDLSLENKVIEEIRRVNSKMHGLYADADQGRVANSLYGPIVFNMRKYAIGLLETGFAAPKYSIYDRDQVEGFSLTTLKLLINTLEILARPIYDYRSNHVRGIKERIYAGRGEGSFRDYFGLLIDLAANLTPVTTKWTTSTLKAEGYSDYLIKNYRTAGIYTALLFGLKALCTGLAPSMVPPEPPVPPEEPEDMNFLAALEAKRAELNNAKYFSAHPEARSQDIDEKSGEQRFKGSKADESYKRRIGNLERELAKMEADATRLDAIYLDFLQYLQVKNGEDILVKLGSAETLISLIDDAPENQENGWKSTLSRATVRYIKNRFAYELAQKLYDLKSKSYGPELAKALKEYSATLNGTDPTTFGKSLESLNAVLDFVTNALTKYIGLEAQVAEKVNPVNILGNLYTLNSDNPNWVARSKISSPYGGNILGMVERYFSLSMSPELRKEELKLVRLLGVTTLFSEEDVTYDPTKKESYYTGDFLHLSGSLAEDLRKKPLSLYTPDELAEIANADVLEAATHIILAAKDSSGNTKKFSILRPMMPFDLSSNRYTETPYSSKGMLYYFAYRMYVEQASEPNIMGLLVDPARQAEEVFSLSNVAPSIAVVNTLYNINEERKAAYAKDPFMRDDKKLIVWHDVKDKHKKVTMKVPVVLSYFKLGYYTGTSNWSGSPKYLIDFWGKFPYIRGSKTLMFGYTGASGYENARKTSLGWRLTITAKPIDYFDVLNYENDPYANDPRDNALDALNMFSNMSRHRAEE